jgi:carbon storage regulator
MLVLSRQRDETIMIGDDIEITVVDIRGDKVRLGITAPNTIPVHRKEVYEAIQRENREAAKVRMEDMSNLPKGTMPPPGKNAGGHSIEGKPRPMRPGVIPVTRPGGGEHGSPDKGIQNPPEKPDPTGPG